MSSRSYPSEFKYSRTRNEKLTPIPTVSCVVILDISKGLYSHLFYIVYKYLYIHMYSLFYTKAVYYTYATIYLGYRFSRFMCTSILLFLIAE